MSKNTAIVFGVIFLIVGVWGFFSSPAVGFVAADTVSSIVHVIVGVILLALAAKPSAANALKTVGIVYVVFAVLGFIQGTSVLGIFVTDAATNWVYLVLGVVVALLGFSSKKDMMSSTPQM